jgi:hypothetical protein
MLRKPLPQFVAPNDGFGCEEAVQHSDWIFETKLDLTSRGEAVRSKSEVIIANLLHAKGVQYHYEHPLELGGVSKYPDFTIEDDNKGITYYWEHCGLLHDATYCQRWEEKQQWYRNQQIIPLNERRRAERNADRDP